MMDVTFRELLLRAKLREKEAVLEILEKYRPLMLKISMVQGKFDEDLYQELVYTLLLCIKNFPLS